MNRKIKFICNNKLISADLHPALSLLDFIRKDEKLTGTKEGCREGDCGACTIMVGEQVNGEVVYKNVNSCLFPVADANGKHIVTIEGLNSKYLTPVQTSFVKETATQCGFCTPGFIISLTAYMMNAVTYNYDDAVDSIAGNVCRCTGHTTIKRAVESLLSEYQVADKKNRLKYLVENNFLPEYFISIPEKLKELQVELNTVTSTDKQYLVSGGTDLFVQKWEELLEAEVDILPSTTTGKIRIEAGKVFLKANTTINEIKESEQIENLLPGLYENLKLFGSMPIRNRATVAGNIINASPIGDMVNILMVLNAELHFVDGNNKRTVALAEFYKGYKSVDKSKTEVLSEVSFSIPEGAKFNYEKVSRRTNLDIASVNSSICINALGNKIDSVSLSAGGVAPVPKLLKQTAGFLTGKEISAELLLQADEILQKEIAPISDARGTEEYKRLLLKKLIASHFVKLFPEYINVEVLV